MKKVKSRDMSLKDMKEMLHNSDWPNTPFMGVMEKTGNTKIEVPAKLIVVDNDKSTIEIKVKLADEQAEKIDVELNTTTTVGELYEHIKCVSKIADFTLSHGFDPVVTLLNLEQTMDEA